MNRPQGRPESRDPRPEQRLRGPVLGLVALALLAGPGRAFAQPGGALKDVAFDQKLDAQVPLLTKFRDETGQAVTLADYFGKRPVILVMGYTKCPMLCSQVLGELTRSLKPLDLSIGKDFDVVSVSINPKETPEEADGRRRMFLKRYDRPGAEAGWHALTGDKESIARLADAVGFRFGFNPKLDLYAHASGFVLLTRGGRVSKYFFGVEYPAKELKPALIEASASKIGSPIQKLLLYCYDYDPATGKYTFAIMNAIRVLGVSTALALGTFLFVMFRRDRRMARSTKASYPELPPGPAIL